MGYFFFLINLVVGKKVSFRIFELCAMNKNQPSLTYVADEKLSGGMNSDREVRC